MTERALTIECFHNGFRLAPRGAGTTVRPAIVVIASARPEHHCETAPGAGRTVGEFDEITIDPHDIFRHGEALLVAAPIRQHLRINFADQSIEAQRACISREFRALAGRSPSEFLRLRTDDGWHLKER